MQSGTPDFVEKYEPLAEDATEESQEKGLLVNYGADLMVGYVCSIGGGGQCGLEQFGFYDAADKVSSATAIDWMKHCIKEGAGQISRPRRKACTLLWVKRTKN